MRSLYDMLYGDDARAFGDAALSEEQYRYVLEGAAPIFREASIRDAVPWRVVNEPHKLRSRHVEVVDIGDAEVRPTGTGGTFDRVDQAFKELAVVRLLKNWEVPHLEAITPGQGGIDILSQTGQACGEKVVELENKVLVAGTGTPNKGVTNPTGITTFAGASWTNAGVAHDDLVKAIDDKLPDGAPKGNLALLLNKAQAAKLRTKQVATANFGTTYQEIQALFPGGIHVNSNVTAGKVYVYPKVPTILEYVVYQDLSVKPLPTLDEDPRGRLRVAGTLHVKKASAVVEITGTT